MTDEVAAPRRWVFDVAVGGNLVVTAWGALSVEAAGTCLLRCWVEYPPGRPGLPGPRRPTRAYSELRTTSGLRPLEYVIRTEHGDQVWGMRFEGGRAVATSYDGTRLDVAADSVDFLMGSNCVPHLAAFVERAVREERVPFTGRVFVPESMETMPYSLTPTPDGLRGGLGEDLVVDHAGSLRHLSIPSLGVEATARAAPLPSWPRAARRAVAEPPLAPAPPEVVVRDGEVDSSGGRRIGYTVAVPASGQATAFVLFAGGSGTHDRHGRGAGLDLGYHELLDRLCAQGIASLRYDKRGAGGTPLGDDALSAGFDAIVADARLCLDVARREAASLGVSVFLVGHSEGAWVALRLAAEQGAAGVVALSASARRIDETIVDQVRHHGRQAGLAQTVIDAQVDEFRQFVAAVEAAPESEWEAMGLPGRILARRADAKYYRELLGVDPIALAGALPCPLLVVHGQADQQVAPADAELLADAARAGGVDATLIVVPNVNHILKSAGKPPSVNDYFDRRRHISRVIVQRVGRWIIEHAGG